MNDKKDRQQRNIPCVRGSIVVSKAQKNHQLHITSKSKWFEYDYILFKIKEDYISITKPNLDYRGKFQKPTKQGDFYHLTITGELPLGKFEFDEDDSNEDELVIYYR